MKTENLYLANIQNRIWVYEIYRTVYGFIKDDHASDTDNSDRLKIL